jgi:hypothetical protein
MPQLLKKIFSLSTLALITALVLSGIAAWYSVIGLTAIFAAAVIPIIIMGGSLEIAKVVTTVWLHRYWSKCRWFMKTYLTIAVLVLALVTSMGIFGFLSKAHLDQGIPTGDVAAQISLLDEKISIQRELVTSERENIEAARKTLSQMDAQLSARLERGDQQSDAGVERAVQIRAQQRRERTALNNEISASQKRIEEFNKNIQDLNIEKAPLATSYRQIEAEVGPIKYIAALIYGDNPDEATLERAVRWVIILLIFVFDPLALMLVIASISSYRWEFGDKFEYKPLPPIANDSPYPPFKSETQEEVITPEPILKPTAANYEMTADGGMIKKQDQDALVKKKFFDLKKFKQIRLLNLNLNYKKFTSRLNSNLMSKIKENLSWKKLTDWQKSPILQLLKHPISKLKK